MLYRDSAVLTSLPSSTAESLGDLSQVALFAYQGLYCISQDLLLVYVCMYRFLHKLHLLRCCHFTTIT